MKAHSSGAFTKLRNAIIKLCHVCPSVRTEQLSSHWTGVHEILYWSIFSKIWREISSFINPL